VGAWGEKFGVGGGGGVGGWVWCRGWGPVGFGGGCRQERHGTQANCAKSEKESEVEGKKT